MIQLNLNYPYIINMVTWHIYQIKSQEKYHNTIIKILLYMEAELS